METEIQKFILYLQEEKHTSENTRVSYQRDLKKLGKYLGEQGNTDVCRVTATTLNSYILNLERSGSAASSISRSVASIRAFYGWLVIAGYIKEDPSGQLKAPKLEKKFPEVLSIEDMERLLEQPEGGTPKERRDKAMLELLYATGIRVSELIRLEVVHVNLPLSYIVCDQSGKKRVIPFGKKAKEALVRYLEGAREELLKGREDKWLFTNCSGEQMSRQGFWKLIKHYATKAGIQTEITPHTFRHSFAAHLVKNGADLKAVQEMLGHSDISTTQMYLDMNSNHLRDVYSKAHPRR